MGSRQQRAQKHRSYSRGTLKVRELGQAFLAVYPSYVQETPSSHVREGDDRALIAVAPAWWNVESFRRCPEVPSRNLLISSPFGRSCPSAVRTPRRESGVRKVAQHYAFDGL